MPRFHGTSPFQHHAGESPFRDAHFTLTGENGWALGVGCTGWNGEKVCDVGLIGWSGAASEMCGVSQALGNWRARGEQVLARRPPCRGSDESSVAYLFS